MSDPTKIVLYRRSNTVYYIAYEEGGKRHYKSTRCCTKADALKVVGELRKLLSEKLDDPLLSEFVAELTPDIKARLIPGTVDTYLSALRVFKEFTGNRRLSSISTRQIDAFVRWRLETVKPATVNIDLRSLSAAFGVAVKWQLVRANPFRQVKRVSIPDALPAYLSMEDFQELLKAVREEWLRELIVFAVATGIRRGEMLNLRWEDVNVRQRVIQIQSHGSFRTKHGKRRTIPMSDLTYTMLSQKANRFDSEYVFNRRGQKIGASFLTHLFKNVRRQSVSDRARHKLRDAS
jgi:integrase